MINPFPTRPPLRWELSQFSYFSGVDTTLGLEQPAKDINMDHYPGI